MVLCSNILDLGPVWIRENAGFYRQFSTPALEAGIKVFSK
jgi:hypothetical protein